jgi:hypothetical protein
MVRPHPGILCLRTLSGEEQRYQVTEIVFFNAVGLIRRRPMLVKGQDESGGAERGSL